MALSDLIVDDEKLRNEAAQIVDRAQAAGDEMIDRARTNADVLVSEMSNVINGVLTGLQATLDRTVAGFNASILGLDGWTATINIPPIIIRLTKPPQKGEQ